MESEEDPIGIGQVVVLAGWRRHPVPSISVDRANLQLRIFLLRMKTDGNGWENCFPIFVAIFFYQDQDGKWDSREPSENRNKWEYENEQMCMEIQRKQTETRIIY